MPEKGIGRYVVPRIQQGVAWLLHRNTRCEWTYTKQAHSSKLQYYLFKNKGIPFGKFEHTQAIRHTIPCHPLFKLGKLLDTSCSFSRL